MKRPIRPASRRDLSSAVSAEGMQLRLFDAVPARHIVHAVSDRRCEPLVRRGEVAVITDQPGLRPGLGQWFLFERARGCSIGGWEQRTREIAVAAVDANGGWWMLPPAFDLYRARLFSDGPYPDVGAIAERTLGRVVGIYRPRAPATVHRLRSRKQPFPTI